jgi:hypothetical protein
LNFRFQILDYDFPVSPYLQLVEALQLASLAAEEQLRLFPEFVHAPDEVALFLDDALRRIGPDPRVPDRALQLNQLFDQMSADKNLWTADCVKSHQKWADAREMARAALNDIGEPVEVPTLGDTTFVKGSLN